MASFCDLNKSHYFLAVGRHLSGAAVLISVAACTEGATGINQPLDELSYLGVETRLLETDLVNLRVAIQGGSGEGEAVRYAECAAAQYALIRGFGFARKIRTNVSKEGSVTRADAVYVISEALPDGIATLDAEVVVSDCKESGVPTV